MESAKAKVLKLLQAFDMDLVRRADAEVRWFDLSQSDVLLSLLPFSFDVGLNHMLSTLMIGARLVIVDSACVLIDSRDESPHILDNTSCIAQ